ncbi:MAG TPA: class I SAM-dependent methyltransferase, partial [Polymorphobacter sp.]|nr:class I SAM-dependent methyltransferase [Polymorphobacter sp.]
MHGEAGRPARLSVLGWVLPDLIRNGRLTVIDSDGGTAHFGDGASGPHLTIRLRDRDLPARVALDPAMAMGEAYMDGRFTIENGTIRDLLLIATANLEPLFKKPLPRLMDYLRKLQRLWSGANNRTASRRNVGHHYDLPAELYDLFLDPDRIYSCAYFRTGQETIEAAQLAKIRHLAAKLLIKPDDRVLDIGCGWGALATTLAVDAGARV